MFITPIYDRNNVDIDVANSLIYEILSIGFDNISSEKKILWYYGDKTNILFSSDGQLFSISGEILHLTGELSGLKGALNIFDLNRIENNTVFLADLLSEYGYVTTITTHATWISSDYFKLSDLDRIKTNVLNLIENFDILTGEGIEINKRTATYIDINNIEKYIYDVNELINKMLLYFKYCGDAYCGGL